MNDLPSFCQCEDFVQFCRELVFKDQIAMIYPRAFEAITSERILLSNGVSVSVPKATPLFKAWEGPPPGDTFGGKALLCHEGRPAFAELVILWSFIDVGWEGAWIDSFGGRRLKDYWPDPVYQTVPKEQEALLQRLTGAGARPWDVYCWSGSAVVFAEAKRQKRDSIRSTQVTFLERALDAGLGLESFLIVEWSML